jgi:hypothetical protein
METPKNFEKIFGLLKARYNGKEYSYDKKMNPVVGRLWWTKPESVLWLYSTDNDEEGYEGSQTQLGVNMTGQVVWGYYSHCSCNYYGECDGEHKVYDVSPEQKKHMYELTNVPDEIEVILKEKLKNVLKDFRELIR